MKIKVFKYIIPILLVSGLCHAAATYTGNTDDYGAWHTVQPDVTNGLVFWAPMNQGTGSAVRDVSGYGANGTSTGATWYQVAGKRGMSFDGIDDYVTMPYSTGTNIEGSSSVSLSVWVWPITQDGGTNYILYKRRFVSSSDRGGFFLQNSAATPDFSLSNNNNVTTVTSPSTIGTQTWSHVCGVYNIATGGSVLLYVNGTQVASGTLTSGIGTHSTTAITISSSSTASDINAVLDDIRIYNRALSSSEVLQLYTNGAK